MNIYFTSDNHFFHKNIKKFCPDTRQGETPEEMSELMIQKWNADVGQYDHVYCNGDFSFGWGNNTGKTLDRLNGIKYLVKGNHEKYLRDMEMLDRAGRRRWEAVEDHIFMELDGYKISMFHYPIWEWRDMHQGAFHFYGHVHGRPTGIPGRCMDIGIDTRPNKDMTLWPWEELRDLMLKQEIRTHHGNAWGSM